MGRKLRAVVGRAQEPHLGDGIRLATGLRCDFVQRMPLREGAVQESEKVADHLGKFSMDVHGRSRMAKCGRSQPIATWCASDSQIDASRVERVEDSELLRDLQG